MIVGIRARIWIASAALVAPAVGLVVLARQPDVTRSGATALVAGAASHVVASASRPPARDGADVLVGSVVPRPPDGVLARSARRREAAPAPPPAVVPASAPPPLAPAPRAVPSDSRVAAELRILEEDAARIAQERGLVDEATLDATLQRVAPAPGAGRDDARRAVLADALLVEHFVEDAYLGTEFPIGYPAEERTRDAAVSQVGGLSAEQRRDLLDILVDDRAEPTAPIAPRFAPPESGLVWEGAIRF